MASSNSTKTPHVRRTSGAEDVYIADCIFWIDRTGHVGGKAFIEISLRDILRPSPAPASLTWGKHLELDSLVKLGLTLHFETWTLWFLLSGQTAVITGAARGLGLAFAEVLAAAKCNIAALDILSEPSPSLLVLASKHGIELEYYRIDITSEADVSKAIKQIETRFPSIDINVNAAGIVQDQPFLTTTLQNIERTFAVNFTGSFLVAQACANSMVRRLSKGQPVNGGSPAASRIDPSRQGGSIATHAASSAQQISAYVASKGAVRSLVKPLAMELAPYGIRVNSLSPGYMMTDMMRGLQQQQPDLVKQFEQETMFGRIGDPDEVKGPMLFLCARGASGWVTGQDILVDGGATSWKHPAQLASTRLGETPE